MKRLTTVLVLAAVALLLGLPSPAAAGVQFGLKAGGNIAGLTGGDIDNLGATLTTKVGFVGGVFLALNFGKVVTIQSEVLYTMKGASYEYVDELDQTVSGKLYGDYIEIPLLLKIKFPLPVVQPFIFAGPSVGFKLSEKITADGETLEPGEEAIFENNDYGAVFGAGLGLGRNLHFDVRYSLGLQKVWTALLDDTELDINNGVFSATLGFAF